MRQHHRRPGGRPLPLPFHAARVQLMGKIRGSFNTLERLLDRLEKSQREVEESPARARL